MEKNILDKTETNLIKKFKLDPNLPRKQFLQLVEEFHTNWTHQNEYAREYLQELWIVNKKFCSYQ
jgi:hypothetical protein